MLASENSASCSVAMRDTSAFQSTRFIAARHDELEGESVHQLIHKFEYRNYYRDIREVVTPIFGLGTEETVDLINKILDSPRVDWSRVSMATQHGVVRFSVSRVATPSSPLCECHTACLRIGEGDSQ